MDVDYKALSNAGTWFVGKLGTEQDKERLLDGLSTAIGGGMDRKEYDDLISRLGKRVFLLRNVHEKHSSLFQTRWAMNYLAGPVTRNQIPALNELVGAVAVAAPAQHAPSVPTAPVPAATPAPPAVSESAPELGLETRPRVPARVQEYFLPNNLTLEEAAATSHRQVSRDAKNLGLLYRPVLLAQADIRFTNRKYKLDTDVQRAVLVEEPDRRGNVRWDEHSQTPFDERGLERRPASDARFVNLEPPLSDVNTLRALEKDFEDWAYRTSEVKVRAHETLDVYASPEVPEAEFVAMCREAADEKREAETKKVTASFDKKIKGVRAKLAREERELKEDEADLSARKQEEMGTHLDTILRLFGGRSKSVSTSLRKRRMTQQAKMDVEESVEAISEFAAQLETLAKEKEGAVAEIEEKWDEIVADVTEIPVSPFKKDISVALFGVAWFPYHVVEAEGRTLELAGFGVD